MIWGQYFTISSLISMSALHTHLTKEVSFLLTDTCLNLLHQGHCRQLDTWISHWEIRPNIDRVLIKQEMCFLLSGHSIFVQHRVLFKQCSIAACTSYLHSGELGKRLCAGGRGPWKVPVILKTVGHKHFQAVTHPLVRTIINPGQGQCPAFDGLLLSTSHLHKRGTHGCRRDTM